MVTRVTAPAVGIGEGEGLVTLPLLGPGGRELLGPGELEVEALPDASSTIAATANATTTRAAMVIMAIRVLLVLLIAANVGQSDFLSSGCPSPLFAR